jgi:hypothetical protein
LLCAVGWVWRFGAQFTARWIRRILDAIETILAICLLEKKYMERMAPKEAIAVFQIH